MNIATLSSKHQIVIPKAMRQELDMEAGTKVIMYPLDDKRMIIMKKPKRHTDALAGLGADVWKNLGGGEKYLEAERSSWD